MRNIISLIIISLSNYLFAQEVACDCGRIPMVEFGNSSQIFKDFDDNEKTYQWYAVYKSPEALCIPQNFTNEIKPLMQKAILEALINEGTYKRLSSTNKVFNVDWGSGGFGMAGSYSSDNRADVRIELQVNIQQFVSSFKTCDEEERDKKLTKSSSNSSSNSNQNSGFEQSSQSNSSSDANRTQESSEKGKTIDNEYSQEAIAKKNQQREVEVERRRAAAESENQQIQENAAAMGALMLVVGGFIYQEYGSLGEVYTGDNFLFGIEAGFGLTVDPDVFTIDLNFKPKFGYQRLINFDNSSLFNSIEIGATLTPNFTLGMRPDLAYQTSYAIGGRVFGGLPAFKLFYDYEGGVRSFGLPEPEIGFENGYSSHKFGFQISKYNHSKILRNHFYFGLIRENINGYGQTESGSFEPYTYNGYMFEWYKEHHGRLFVHLIPDYKTNPAFPAAEEDPVFIKVGFSRVLETFETRVNRENRNNRSPKRKEKLNRDNASFLMYTYDNQNYLGLSFGGLKKNEISYYANITGGSSVYDEIEVREATSYVNAEIDDEGKSSNSLKHFDTQGQVENATLIAASVGITFKLKYPVFGYFGIGLAYVEQYERVREYETFYADPFDPGAESELVWYQNTDGSGVRLFPEIGLKYNLLNTIVLKYGISYRNELFSQVGVGFALY